MIDFHLLKLEINIGQNFWKTVLATTGTILGGYGVYRFFANRKYVSDVNNKCVLITGCGRGFGRALAMRLDALGCPVFAGCYRESSVQELNAETSSRLRAFQLDVTSSESIKNALEFVKANMEPGTELWGVVNNAGIAGSRDPAEFMAIAEYENVMRVNFIGPVEVINTFLPLLKTSRGRIVNISSISAKAPSPYDTAYVASKCAMMGYSEALRREKKIWGIRVATIMPGSFKTNFLDSREAKEKQWENLSAELKEEYGQEYHDAAMKLVEEYVNKVAKPDLRPVVNAMEHALFSVKPNATYTVGRDAKMYSFLEVLPFGIMDRLYGTPPKDLLPKALRDRN